MKTRFVCEADCGGALLNLEHCNASATNPVGSEGVPHGRHDSTFNRPSGTFNFRSRVPALRFAACRANYNRASLRSSGRAGADVLEAGG